ncbi:DUF6578 domain-containing protein [Oerskovia enterophila]|uniref:DUF6578 domain-containing protein n=1 Tax=Oerskovia enterophila TaxID=43678 RepID=UPI003823A1B5
MQCCGTPFAVGDDVEWGVSHGGHDEVLEDIFDEASAPQCFGSEEHHGDVDETIQGRVTAIAVVRAQLEQAAEDPRMCGTSKGTGTADPIRRANGLEGERDDHRLFGYLVDIDIVSPD